MNVLKARMNNKSKYVFPNPVTNLPFHKDHFKYQWIEIKILANAPTFTLKDLRSSFSASVKRKYGLSNEEVAIYCGHDEKMQRLVYDPIQEAAKQKVVQAISQKPRLSLIK
jgi:integrase